MDNSAEAGGGAVSDPIDDADGRVGSLLCSLHAMGFSGALSLEAGEDALTVVFHVGNPVFVELDQGGEGLSKEFIRAGLIDQAGLNDVAAHTDVVGSCMEMAFCARAVELGRVAGAEASVIAMEWVRTHILRAMRFQDCLAYVDDSVHAPASIHGWSQPLGPLVYLGVRTFYGQSDIDAIMQGDEGGSVHFVAPVEAAVDFFGLDSGEAKHLAACAPRCEVRQLLQLGGLDALHAGQLLVLLRFAGFVDVSAFGLPEQRPAGEASGLHPMAGRPAMPPSARQSMPSGPTEGMSALEAAAAATRARAQGRSSAGYRKPVHGMREEVGPRKPRSVQRLSKELGMRQPSAGAPTRQSSGPVRSSRAPATGAREASRAPRAGSSRTPGSGTSRTPAAGAPNQSRAHLEALMRRRNARVGGAASASPPSDKVDPEACYQRAKVEMGQERHAKAVELMRQACEADAENAFYSAYLLWAQFREEGGMDADSEYATELRGMLRGMLAAGEHNDFANHALGHIAYAAQDWQRAEKFFKKSLDANKRNRDAERYLRIVERRKKQKSSDEPQKIFGIEISGRVGKKD